MALLGGKYMQTQNNAFHACDFFQIRIPVYPIEKLENANTENILEIFEEDKYFQEALFYANKELYEKTITQNNSCQNNAKIKRTLLNYFRRMITRATPMGLFSGVTNGEFSSVSQYNLDWKFEKRYSVNNSWLFGLINQLESEKRIIKNLLLKSNPNVYIKNERIYLYFNDKINLSDEQTITSIKASDPVCSVIELCKNSLPSEELLKSMTNKYGNENISNIFNLIKEMIVNRYLLTSLNVPYMTLENLINFEKSNNYKKDARNLMLVQSKLLNLNSADNNHIEDLAHLNKLMNEIIEDPHPIQENTLLNNLGLSIDKMFAKEIEEAFSWLWEHGGKSHYTDNMKYYSSFVDVYGEDNRIPLLEVYTRLPLHKVPIDMSANNFNIFLPLVLEALICGQWEVFVHNLKDKEKKEVDKEIPDVEIYGRIIGEAQGTQNKMRFITNTRMINYTVGGTFGRFLNTESEISVTEKLRKNYDDKYCELIFNLKNKFWTNVLASGNVLKNKIFLNYFSDEYDSLEQLYVVAHNQKFYIWTEKEKKYITTIKFDMFNEKYMPSILRMILNLQRYNRYLFNYKIFSQFDTFTFCPRIVYKNVIFRPATWHLNYEYIKGHEWNDFINNFKIKYRLKRYVNYVASDRKLLIDTNNLHDLVYLGNLVKKEKNIILEEIIELENCFIKKGKEQYLNEIVVPLKGRKDEYYFESYNWENKFFLPVDEYLFINLYLNNIDMDNVLINELLPFTNSVIKHGLAKDFFYIRYIDNNYHLRIRFRGISQNSIDLISLTNTWYKMLYEKRIVNYLSILTYIPEINRYGGEKYFKYVEDYFCKDSIFAIELLSFLKDITKKDDYCLEVIITYALICQLKNMRFSYADFVKNIDLENKANKNLINYRKERKTLFEFFLNSNKRIILSIRKLVKKRDENSKLYMLMEIEDKTRIYNIVSNMLHMTCNRFSLTDRMLEKRVREMLRCYLRDLKFWEELKW